MSLNSLSKKRDVFDEELKIDGDAGTGASLSSVSLTVNKLDRPVKMIPIDKIIKSSPTQTRLVNFDPENIPEDADLLKSIMKKGVLEPIMVFPIPDSNGDVPIAFGGHPNYYMVYGHRRFEASIRAGLKFIPASIAKDETEARELTLVENTGTRLLTQYERALSLVRLKEEYPDENIADVAEKCGIRGDGAYHLYNVLKKSPEPLLDLFKNGMDVILVRTLIPVFESLPLGSDQIRLASLVKDIPRKQASLLADAVKSGIDPFSALNLTVPVRTKSAKVAVADQPSVAINSQLDIPSSVESPVTSPSNTPSEKPASSPKKSPKAVVTAASEFIPDNKEAVVFMAEIGRITPRQVKQLMEKETLTSPSELALACKLVGAGINTKDAPAQVNALMNNKQAASVLKPIAAALVRSRQTIELLQKTDNADLVATLSLLLYGAPSKE